MTSSTEKAFIIVEVICSWAIFTSQLLFLTQFWNYLLNDSAILFRKYEKILQIIPKVNFLKTFFYSFISCSLTCEYLPKIHISNPNIIHLKTWLQLSVSWKAFYDLWSTLMARAYTYTFRFTHIYFTFEYVFNSK